METTVTDRSSEDQLFARIAWRLVPLLIAIFLVAYIDRANIGFAKLQMLSSLKMSEASYGFASSLFFIGYLVCEVPSNLLMHRFGARRWISRIMFHVGRRDAAARMDAFSIGLPDPALPARRCGSRPLSRDHSLSRHVVS